MRTASFLGEIEKLEKGPVQGREILGCPMKSYSLESDGGGIFFPPGVCFGEVHILDKMGEKRLKGGFS